MERYLRLGGLQNDQAITAKAEEYLKVAISHINFLNFKPSLIAAAAFVISHAIKRTPLDTLKLASINTLDLYFRESL